MKFLRSILPITTFIIGLAVASLIGQSGASLPSTCNTGDIYTITSTTPNLKAICVAGTPTTWSFVPQLSGSTTAFLRGDGTWVTPTASAAWGGITGTLSSQTDLQTVLDLKLSSLIRLDQLVAPIDNTTLNATSLLHGLLPKLSGTTTTFLRGDGTWTTIPLASTATTLVTPRAIYGQNFDGSAALSGTVTGSTSVVTPLFQSTVAKLLFQGTGSGATQLASTQTTKPTCTTNCGSGSPTVTGSDSDMIVTLGTTPASGFVVNFNATWAAAPSCQSGMAKAGMAVGKLPLTAVASTTIVTIVTNGVAPSTGDIYVIHCRGIQ